VFTARYGMIPYITQYVSSLKGLCSRCKPGDGLFKPKHAAYCSLYCEFCMIVWKMKYTCEQHLDGI
jgi:hypothetical protein